LYDLGDGVERSDADAAAWYRRAADQGDAIAMTELSHHLRQGRGVAQDVAESWRLLTKAAEAGLPVAQTELGMFYEDGFGHEQAARWLGEAARQGDGLAQFQLGQLYAQGLGVDRDLDQARRLFTQAAASPEPSVAEAARASLAALTPAPSPVPPPSSAAAPTAVAPPQRRLPTQPSVSASDRSDATAKIAVGVGLTVGAILLLNHFFGSESQDATESSTGSGFGGGTSTTPGSFGSGASTPAQPVTAFPGPPPPRPMTGNIGKILDGAAGMSSSGVIRK
jgi:hypothetical protein